jgi:hypothetical protein
MSKEQYVVICPTEDGEVYIESMSKETLEARLTARYWGESSFFTAIPDGLDAQEWDAEGLLILKATVVVPKPKTVVEAFEV